VLVIPPLKKILCPVDCSDPSRTALDYALFVSKSFGAAVHVLHVWHVSHHVRPDLSVWLEAHGQKPISALVEAEAKAQTDAFLSRLSPEIRTGLTVHLLEGEAWRVITDVAKSESVDLVVMGTHGRTGIGHMLGSVAEKVVRAANCPVLTVRSGSTK
jgi:nucleotide-binding universal stress UspA family protein